MAAPGGRVTRVVRCPFLPCFVVDVGTPGGFVCWCACCVHQTTCLAVYGAFDDIAVSLFHTTCHRVSSMHPPPKSMSPSAVTSLTMRKPSWCRSWGLCASKPWPRTESSSAKRYGGTGQVHPCTLSPAKHIPCGAAPLCADCRWCDCSVGVFVVGVGWWSLHRTVHCTLGRMHWKRVACVAKIA